MQILPYNISGYRLLTLWFVFRCPWVRFLAFRVYVLSLWKMKQCGMEEITWTADYGELKNFFSTKDPLNSFQAPIVFVFVLSFETYSSFFVCPRKQVFRRIRWILKRSSKSSFVLGFRFFLLRHRSCAASSDETVLKMFASKLQILRSKSKKWPKKKKSQERNFRLKSFSSLEIFFRSQKWGESSAEWKKIGTRGKF